MTSLPHTAINLVTPLATNGHCLHKMGLTNYEYLPQMTVELALGQLKETEGKDEVRFTSSCQQ